MHTNRSTYFAMKSELNVPDRYVELLTLLLTSSDFRIQASAVRITAEVELDLLLSTLLRVRAPR